MFGGTWRRVVFLFRATQPGGEPVDIPYRRRTSSPRVTNISLPTVWHRAHVRMPSIGEADTGNRKSNSRGVLEVYWLKTWCNTIGINASAPRVR